MQVTEQGFRHKIYILIASAMFVHNLFRTHKYLVINARLVQGNAIMYLTLTICNRF